MKKKLYIITTFILSAAVLTLSSCLKDPRVQDFSNVGTLIELPLEAYNGPGVLVADALPIQAAAQTIPVVVNIASPKPLSTALTVTLAIDQPALDAYNHANGLDTGGNTPYVIPPSNAYSIASFKVTIPAGQRTANLNVTINTSNLDPNGLFVIPISITDGGGQKISNYKTVLLNVQAKNKYDGAYTANGTFVDVTNAALVPTGVYPENIYLVTQGANTVAFEDVNQGFAHLIFSTATNGFSIYGTFAPEFTFDPATNNITAVTNLYVNPANGRGARIDPTGANTFTTGSPGDVGAIITVKYIMTQPSAGGDRTFFSETYKYTGPRP